MPACRSRIACICRKMEDWASDPERRHKTGIPEDIGFQTKPAIALEQIRAAAAAGVPRGVVLMDAGYGNDTDLRTNLSTMELCYVAGIQSSTTLWAPRTMPLPAKAWSGRGRPPETQGLADGHLARRLGRSADLALWPRSRARRPSRRPAR